MGKSLHLTDVVKEVAAFVLLSQVALAQTPDCAAAVRWPLERYSAAAGMDGSETGQDEAALVWSQCRAQHLQRSLRRSPKLQARITALRREYQQLRDLEGKFAEIRAGGGTLYSHAALRRYAPLESQLAVLTRLARTQAGGVQRPQYARTVRQAQQKQAEAIATLRFYRPKPNEDYVEFNAAQWQQGVNTYAQVSRRIMQTLGTRGDAATAQGYTMLTDWVFTPSGEP